MLIGRFLHLLSQLSSKSCADGFVTTSLYIMPLIDLFMLMFYKLSRRLIRHLMNLQAI